MTIRKSDIIDADIVDAYELNSDGYSIYLTTTLVSTDNTTQTIIINLPANGEGLTSIDNPAQASDVVYLVSTGGADGYYIINNIIDDVTFTVNPPIQSSTGGTIYFMYQSGALNVGFNPIGKTDIDITSTNVQDAINDLDKNKLNENEHETLRQLIHFIDQGPGDGFASGAYKETTPFGVMLPTNITWYEDNTKNKKIVEQIIEWSGIVPSTITWNVYNIDGATITHTVIDTISYMNNIFETSRTRTII